MARPPITYATAVVNSAMLGKPILAEVKFSFDRASKKFLFISCTIR